jgi:hypothetical protein
MKEKLLQLWEFVKAGLKYTFIVLKRCAKVIVEETIKVLQYLDTFLG